MKRILFIATMALLLSGCGDLSVYESYEMPEELYEVVQVFDGDTIEVLMDGRREKVRFIGVDAPETDGPYTEAECYGEEAKHYLTYLLDETSVYLLPDPTQDDRDAYGRLLRYAFTAQADNVGRLLLEQGYVREFTFIDDYNFKDNYLAAQARAQAQEAGLWSPEVCPP